MIHLSFIRYIYVILGTEMATDNRKAKKGTESREKSFFNGVYEQHKEVALQLGQDQYNLNTNSKGHE